MRQRPRDAAARARWRSAPLFAYHEEPAASRMKPRPRPENDPLSREVEAAQEGMSLQELDLPSARAPREGAPRLLRGTVVGLSGDDVIVELGPRMQGVLSRAEFDPPGPEVGKVHDFSLRGREEDGLWRLSLSEARSLSAWDELSVGSLVEARVSGVNTGGLELRIGPIAAFLPASHIALERVEDLHAYLGQKLVCAVLEVDRERKRVLLSRRSVLAREREEARAAAVGAIQVGDTVNGKVSRLEPYGAFVEIAAGLEGLLHVSNISHRRLADPSEVLQKGQDLRLQVLSIEEGGRRIGLGLKQLQPDPWKEAAESLLEGALLTGRVVRLAEFGAFVELYPGVEGLVHVSQLAPQRVRKSSEAVALGAEVTVRVLSVDTAARRVALSRLDPRGALIGSEDSAESSEVDRVLRQQEGGIATNLGSLFRKALDQRER